MRRENFLQLCNGEESLCVNNRNKHMVMATKKEVLHLLIISFFHFLLSSAIVLGSEGRNSGFPRVGFCLLSTIAFCC